MSNRRPAVIIVVCTILALSALLTLPGVVYLAWARHFGSVRPLLAAGSVAVTVTTAVGLWNSRRWSVVLYGLYTAVSQLILAAFGEWHAPALLFPLALFVVMVSQWPKLH